MSASTDTGAAVQGSRLARGIGKWVAVSGVGLLLLGATQAFAGTVVTDQVFNLSTQPQASVPVTFGQVFKDGDVPQGATLTATLNGQPITLQVDPKATNPDGSLRHAVLSVIVPSLAAGAKLPLTLSTGATLPAGQTIGLSQLLATNYDASASLNIGGKTYTVNARPLLVAADNAGTCKVWGTQCNVWLSGPLASEWVVNAPVTASDGTTNPNLRVYFAVRAYSDGTPGTVGRVRTDIIVENDWAYMPQAQPQYTATLTSGSASYTSPALTQYDYTRWHKVLWWNNTRPDVYLQQDTQYIQSTMAVSRYMPLTPDASFLASLRQTCAPLANCDQTIFMGDTGAQPAIGPLPRWTSVYIVDPDVRAYNWMLANTDALGAYSIHYRDGATGFPLSIQRHPYVTVVAWGAAASIAQQSNANGLAYAGDLLPNCVNNAVVSGCTVGWYGTGNPNTWDNAHQPAGSYVPYMVTGSWYYMSELAFDASYNEVWSNPGYRGFSQGLIDQAHSQVRGKAWTLRNMADAAWLLPDSYPSKAEFNADVENSLGDWNAKYTNSPNPNPLHLPNDATNANLNGGRQNGLPPWQEAFLVWSVNHAAELGFSSAVPFRDWLARFDIGLMTDWQADPTHGYCWLEASQYQIQVRDNAGNWLPTFAAVYAANFPSLVGLACNSPGMAAAMGKLESLPWQVGEMHGYASSATGFPSNLQIGLAAIADSGAAGAAQAWNVFDSRIVKPVGTMAYNDYPNFAVIPRSTPDGTQAPPTMPPTSNPPTSNPPPTNPPPSNPPLTAFEPPPRANDSGLRRQDGSGGEIPAGDLQTTPVPATTEMANPPQPSSRATDISNRRETAPCGRLPGARCVDDVTLPRRLPASNAALALHSAAVAVAQPEVASGRAYALPSGTATASTRRPKRSVAVSLRTLRDWTNLLILARAELLDSCEDLSGHCRNKAVASQQQP